MIEMIAMIFLLFLMLTPFFYLDIQYPTRNIQWQRKRRIQRRRGTKFTCLWKETRKLFKWLPQGAQSSSTDSSRPPYFLSLLCLFVAILLCFLIFSVCGENVFTINIDYDDDYENEQPTLIPSATLKLSNSATLFPLCSSVISVVKPCISFLY